MSKLYTRLILLLLVSLQTKQTLASAKYYWISASQGRVNNIVDGFAPFQLQVGRNSSGTVTFRSKYLNLAIKSDSKEKSYPVNIQFNPTSFCSIDAVPFSSFEMKLEVNNIQYNPNSNILIEDDQFRQYRIIVKLFGVSPAKRGSVLCDIKNALVIVQ